MRVALLIDTDCMYSTSRVHMERHPTSQIRPFKCRLLTTAFDSKCKGAETVPTPVDKQRPWYQPNHDLHPPCLKASVAISDSNCMFYIYIF